MGLDMMYQAMPDDCALMERARRDAEFALRLRYFEQHIVSITLPEDEPVEHEFEKEAQRTMQLYPGIEKRNLYNGNRTWDKIYYLLSEKRRNKVRERDDLATKVVWGGERLHPEIIEFPVRYLTPSEVDEVVAFLEPITYDMMQQHFNPALMIEAVVYKITQSQNFERVWTDFEELRNFYNMVQQYREGVITSLD
jgi:hypothetical protein